VVFRPIDLYAITSTFLRFLRFFKIQKSDFLRFFALFHTFSRTMSLSTEFAKVILIIQFLLKLSSMMKWRFYETSCTTCDVMLKINGQRSTLQ